MCISWWWKLFSGFFEAHRDISIFVLLIFMLQVTFLLVKRRKVLTNPKATVWNEKVETSSFCLICNFNARGTQLYMLFWSISYSRVFSQIDTAMFSCFFQKQPLGGFLYKRYSFLPGLHIVDTGWAVLDKTSILISHEIVFPYIILPEIIKISFSLPGTQVF